MSGSIPLCSLTEQSDLPSFEINQTKTQRGGGTVSISLPAKIGVECGLPSGDPPACSTVTAYVAPLTRSGSYELSTGRDVKSLAPITPSERGFGSLSEISHSSKLEPGSAAAPTLRTVKFLVASSTVRMKAGPPPSLWSTATYCPDALGAGALASATCAFGFGRMLSGSRSGIETPTPIITTSAAAMAEVAVAIAR